MVGSKTKLMCWKVKKNFHYLKIDLTLYFLISIPRFYQNKQFAGKLNEWHFGSKWNKRLFLFKTYELKKDTENSGKKYICIFTIDWFQAFIWGLNIAVNELSSLKASGLENMFNTDTSKLDKTYHLNI